MMRMASNSIISFHYRRAAMNQLHHPRKIKEPSKTTDKKWYAVYDEFSNGNLEHNSLPLMLLVARKRTMVRTQTWKWTTTKEK